MRQPVGVTVASFTDAWIETSYLKSKEYETVSHLLQMRGLKPIGSRHLVALRKSHLLQMRGLKLLPNRVIYLNCVSHLLQMRGLKLKLMILMSMLIFVASFTDAWIETIIQHWQRLRI